MSYFNLLQVGKCSPVVRNGMLCLYRMCNKEAHPHQSTNQSTSQVDISTYKVPEYYQYDEYSFNDLLNDMQKYHLPRPSCKSGKDKK